MKWFWQRAQENPDYKIYTTKFDVETSGATLTADLSLLERSDWEAQVELYRSGTEIVRTEVGLQNMKSVDAVRAKDTFDASETVVSVLVDHSGSMKGQRAIIACFVVEMVADFLSRIGVKYEILGFTTVGWLGGRSRRRWLRRFAPRNPGRLNDILHIVYRDARDVNSSIPYNMFHLLRSALLKENIDGEALFWASERLKNLDSPNNVILVISDGAPVDDSTLQVNAPDILMNHLRAVIADIQNTDGFKLAGIGIDYDVDQFYPKSIQIEGVNQVSASLPDFLVDLF